LEFTDLGGTRNVIRPLDPPKAQGGDDDDDDDDDSESGGGDGGGFRDEPDEDLVPFSPNALSVLVKDMGTSVQASCVCTLPRRSLSHPHPCPVVTDIRVRRACGGEGGGAREPQKHRGVTLAA